MHNEFRRAYYALKVFTETCYKLEWKKRMFGWKVINSLMLELVDNWSYKYVEISFVCQWRLL